MKNKIIIMTMAVLMAGVTNKYIWSMPAQETSHHVKIGKCMGKVVWNYMQCILHGRGSGISKASIRAEEVKTKCMETRIAKGNKCFKKLHSYCFDRYKSPWDSKICLLGPVREREQKNIYPNK